MRFVKTSLPGVFLITLESYHDERGYFSRSFCKDTLENEGLCSEFFQCNISFNKKKGTLRGLHFQIDPHEEVKLVRCVKGSVYDVVLDLRKDSPTYKKHQSFELSSKNLEMLYIPHGFAHGFQTLEPESELFYHMSSNYVPEASRGVLWNDPAFSISWPMEPSIISQKDQQYPLYS